MRCVSHVLFQLAVIAEVYSVNITLTIDWLRVTGNVTPVENGTHPVYCSIRSTSAFTSLSLFVGLFVEKETPAVNTGTEDQPFYEAEISVNYYFKYNPRGEIVACTEDPTPLLTHVKIIPPCPGARYGETCNISCGQCASGMRCHRWTGLCDSCAPGWTLPNCTQECSLGRFGNNCTGTCGRCGGFASCDKMTGHCASCLPGWVPPLCQISCPFGQYGAGCRETCGLCSGVDDTCDKTTGHCLSCQPGWRPPLCKQECPDLQYGMACNGMCGLCAGNGTCNKTTGHCASCLPGVMPPLCQQDCPDGQYGSDCNQTCGHCAGNDTCGEASTTTATCDACDSNAIKCGTCNKTTGYCLSCLPGWLPPLCDQRKRKGSSGGRRRRDIDVLQLLTYIGLGFLILAAACFASLVIKCWRARKRRRSEFHGQEKYATYDEAERLSQYTAHDRQETDTTLQPASEWLEDSSTTDSGNEDTDSPIDTGIGQTDSTMYTAIGTSY